MVTLHIPTLNRSEFLERLLNYYADTNYQHWIFIGDASDEYHAARNRNNVRSLGSRLKIKYFHYPGLSIAARLEQLGLLTQTPYCAYSGDDDFLCTSGIDRCLAFLASNPDYGAAHGKGIYLSLDRSGPYGKISVLGSYPQAVTDANTGKQRLKDYFNPSTYAVLFSVHRTPNWQEMWRGLSSLQGVPDKYHFEEIIPNCLSLILGKMKQLDCLYLIHQRHPGSIGPPNIYDWITSAGWYPSFKLFHDRLLTELIRRDGISVEEAEEVIKRQFWPFLSRTLNEMWQLNTNRSPLTIRGLTRRIPGARRAWRALFWSTAQKEMSLPKLLNPSSPYQADFVPICRAITIPPSGSKPMLSQPGQGGADAAD